MNSEVRDIAFGHSQISYHPADSNAEISVLRDQLAAAQARASCQSIDSSAPARTPSERSSIVTHTSKSLEDDLLHTQPPPDLELPDFPPETDIPISVPDAPRPSTSSADSESGQSILLQRAGFPLPRHKMTSPQTPVSLSRSTTLPSLSAASRIPPRTAVNRSALHAAGSTAPITASGVAPTTSKNRGVQMVSEMRAKVKNLEQKIHTRVPRLRMGSMSRPSPSAMPTSNSRSSNLSPAGSSQSIKSPDDHPRPSLLGRRTANIDENKRTPASSSGWVLIMEDSPSPTKAKERDHRRASSPPSAVSFPALASLATSIQSGSLGTPDVSQNVQSSGLRRPQSRLSTSTEGRSSVSTTATVSSIPTPVSRPATPTFIPLPSSGLYAHPTTAGATGLKRPSGPGFGGAYFKRSSLGSTTGDSPPSTSSSDGGFSRPTLSSLASHAAASPTSTTSPSHKESFNTKPLPQTPHPNITVRSQSKLPTPLLSQSRIGRPSFGASGRRSAGADNSDVESRFLDARDKGRPRSGSGRS
jgi:nuclear distribution protein NudE